MKTEQDLIRALDAVVLYKVDAEKGDGKTLAKEFKVRGYPTFALLNAEGQTIDRWMGYEKQFFINTLGEATADLRTIEEKSSGINASAAASLGRYNAATNNFAEAVKYYKAAQELNSDPDKEYADDIFNNMMDGYDKIFSYEEVSKAADQALLSKKLKPLNGYYIAAQMAELSLRAERKDMATKYIQTGLNYTKTLEEAGDKKPNTEMQILQALHINNDPMKAFELKKTTMPDGWMDDTNQLNSFAWWCFERNVNLPEAEKLSKRSVDLAEPGKTRGMNLDTLAEIKFAMGNAKEAVKLEQKAVKEDPENKFYQEQVERFKKGTGK